LLEVVAFVIGGLSFGQHTLMQDANDANASQIPCAEGQGERDRKLSLIPDCQPTSGSMSLIR
jgi:hypothetical protein